MKTEIRERIPRATDLVSWPLEGWRGRGQVQGVLLVWLSSASAEQNCLETFLWAPSLRSPDTSHHPPGVCVCVCVCECVSVCVDGGKRERKGGREGGRKKGKKGERERERESFILYMYLAHFEVVYSNPFHIHVPIPVSMPTDSNYTCTCTYTCILLLYWSYNIHVHVHILYIPIHTCMYIVTCALTYTCIHICTCTCMSVLWGSQVFWENLSHFQVAEFTHANMPVHLPCVLKYTYMYIPVENAPWNLRITSVSSTV